MQRSSHAATIRVLAAVLVLGAASAGYTAEDLGYDPQADPAAQLAAGVARAKAADRLVLVIAGGDWCIWCHYLNAFVEENSDVGQALYDTFDVVKVYYGDENKNEPFFSSWPEADGYPHFWIFSADGNLLRSQPTLELEDGAKSYDKKAFSSFVAGWRDR